MNKINVRNHRTRVIAAAMLVWMIAAVLAGCSSDHVKVDVHLTYDAEQDALVDQASGRTYYFASVSYEPASVGAAYADWTDEVLLYCVDGWSPEKLLTEKWNGIGGLLYAAEHPLPTLMEMNADQIYVCTSGQTTSCLTQITDRKLVDRAAYAFETGEAVALPEDGTTSYYLKFASTDYAGIYYNLVYIERGTGENMQVFLYDRGTKKCAELPVSLFDGVLYSTTDEGTEDANAYTMAEGEDIVISFGDES